MTTITPVVPFEGDQYQGTFQDIIIDLYGRLENRFQAHGVNGEITIPIAQAISILREEFLKPPINYDPSK